MSGLPDLAGKCLWWMGWGVQRTVFEDGMTPQRRGNILGHTVECCHCPVKSVHAQDHRRTEERLVIVAIISLSPLYWMRPLTGKGCPSGGFSLCLVLEGVVEALLLQLRLPCCCCSCCCCVAVAVAAAVLLLQLLLLCCRCSCCCCFVVPTAVIILQLLSTRGYSGRRYVIITAVESS